MGWPAICGTGLPVLVLITLGMLVDSMTNLPSLINNAVAIPELPVCLQLPEQYLALPALIIGTQKGGIIGTALAHLIASVIATTTFMVYVHGRSFLPHCLI